METSRTPRGQDQGQKRRLSNEMRTKRLTWRKDKAAKEEESSGDEEVEAGGGDEKEKKKDEILTYDESKNAKNTVQEKKYEEQSQKN